jgi:hypothetical protein
MNSSQSHSQRSQRRNLDRLGTVIVRLNPAQDIEVCLRLSVLCCPVEVQVFHVSVL